MDGTVDSMKAPKPLIINRPHFYTTLFITTCRRLSTRELLEIECPNFSKFISGLVCVLQCCIGYIVVVCHS